jgi:hypothetical protein
VVGYHIEERHDAVVVNVVNDGHDCYIVDIGIAVDRSVVVCYCY